MNKKKLIIIGIILLCVGLILISEGESTSHYTVGDPTVKSMAKAPYEKWGTIFSVAGGVAIVGGFIYKGNNTTENKINNESKTSTDSTAQLEELKSLLDKGVITQEEFDAKKKKILDKI